MFRALACASTLLVLIPSGIAWAKKAPGNRGLETPTTVEASEQRGNARYSLETGAALHLSDLSIELTAGDPESMAREALRVLADQLLLADSETRDLRLHAVRRGLSGTTVRFHQYVEGMPVHRAEVAVTFNYHGALRTVASSYDPRAAALAKSGAPTLESPSRERAVEKVLSHLGMATDGSITTSTHLVVLTDKGVSRWAQRVRTKGGGSDKGEWEAMVDVETGEILKVDDTLHYIDGSGEAFMPDPLSSATVDYGDPGYTDGNDADTPQLLAEISTVTLRDITENAGTYSLVGPWAEILDHESPFKGLFSQNSPTWNPTRFDDAFEATNTYFHIDAYMRYLNDTLGLNIRPYQYATGVRFDPHGFGGADNSSYSTGSGRLQFGEGGVDDAEDADVVIHELGHGLHDWVTSGGLSQVNGLSEGVGDYAAVSYSRTFVGQWTPADPQYNWVFSWDGHNNFWSGRVTNYNDTNTYPDDLTGFAIHTDGQFWASCNIDIWETIGGEKTDISFWEGLARTNGSSSHDDAAQAVVDATADIITMGGGAFGHTIADLEAIVSIYEGCGYTISAPDVSTVFVDGFESGGVGEWSSSQGLP